MSAKRTPGDKAPKKGFPFEQTPEETAPEQSPPQERVLGENSPKKKPPGKKRNTRLRAGADPSEAETSFSGINRFPTVGDLANLAAALTSKQPEEAKGAHDVLVRSALSLWQAARDCLMEEKQREEELLKRIRISERLKKTGAHELVERLQKSQESRAGSGISWKEARDLIFHDLPPEERDEALARLVTKELPGRSTMRETWIDGVGAPESLLVGLLSTSDFQKKEVMYFKADGFSRAAANILLEIWDRREDEAEDAAKSLKFSILREKREEKRRARKRNAL